MVCDRHQRPLAWLLFGSAAWKTAVTDRFIGWSPTFRQANLKVPIKDLPWPFQLPFYEPKPGEPMPDSLSLAVADERLKPTPTPEEAAAMAAAEAAEAASAAGAR